MIEFPEESRAGSSSSDGGQAWWYRAGVSTETEAWLRRELAFLHRVERRILRRARWREEAWRAVAVACILAVFSLCWYLAAVSANGSSSSCKGAATTATAAAHGSGTTSTTNATGSTDKSGSTDKTTSGTAASCGS